MARELAALGNSVPALEACAAAGRGGVLGDEHGVAAVRRLLAVLVGRRGSEPRGQELLGVSAHGLHAAELDRRGLTVAEVELRAERLPGQPLECRVDRHRALESRADAPSPDQIEDRSSGWCAVLRW